VGLFLRQRRRVQRMEENGVKMKHRILIEFESDHLPDDFTDQVAGRVYMMPCVNKVEFTATLVGDQRDLINAAQKVIDRFTPTWQDLIFSKRMALVKLNTAIDAAMKGQP